MEEKPTGSDAGRGVGVRFDSLSLLVSSCPLLIEWMAVIGTVCVFLGIFKMPLLSPRGLGVSFFLGSKTIPITGVYHLYFCVFG